MPSYNRWGSHPSSRLPPTPPEYQTAYLTPMSAVSEDNMHDFYPSQKYGSRHTSTRDYHDRHLPSFSSNSYMASQSHSRSKHMSGGYEFPVSYSHQLAPYHYAPISQPILPPIRVTDDLSSFATQFSHTHVEPKQKEEKPTGGVAQHLDYEMDVMASFVAEMSQRMYALSTSGILLTDVNMMRSVTKNSVPTPQFRKYVSQILSSTRLPSSTIMLGLFYLQERMRILSTRRHDSTSPGTVYRMLTTCLLLGSKFLDDNTFQNKSWAEVSSIPVSELNTMELEWLKDFNWEIHNLMYTKEEGFFNWIDHWHAYEEKTQMAKVKEVSKLAPIDTSFSRSQSTSRPLMSPEGPIPAQYQQGSQYETQWARPYMSDYSPPSAPESGPTTPEYYPNTWAYPQANQSFTRGSWNAGVNAFSSHGAPHATYHAPYLPQPYAHAGWAGHGANCGCNLCAKQNEYYLHHGGYRLQSVMG